MLKKKRNKEGYFVTVPTPRFDDGGFTGWLNNSGHVDAVNQGSQLAASGTNMLQPVNGDTNAGLSAASGALSGLGTGAKIGSAFGPEGTIIGAGVGLIGGAAYGLITGGKKHQAYLNEQKQTNQANYFSTRGTMQQSNQGMYGGNSYALGDYVNDGGGKKPKTPAPKPTPVPILDYSAHFPAPGDPYWKTHPLMTEHSDGTYRLWGEKPAPIDTATLQQKLGNAVSTEPYATTIPNNKVLGTGDAANPALIMQQNGQAIPTIHSNSGYYADGGSIDDPVNPFGIKNSKNNVNPVGPNRPLVYLPQKDKLSIQDKRKVNATTGKPLNQDKENISGKYDTDRINNIVHYAKMYGLDPYSMIATDLQETSLGKAALDKKLSGGKSGSPGHVMGDNFNTPSKAKDSIEREYSNNNIDGEQHEDQLGYDEFARAYTDKMKYAKHLGLKSDAQKLQAYNGLGKVFPTTEEDYDGYKKSMYGVPVPSDGLDLKSNPLYGKRVIDYRDNVLKKSPDIQDAVNSVYADGDQVTDGDNVTTQDDPQFQAQRKPMPSQPTAINIEKGELRIDADKGKILQKYDGINPLTGGLFQPHAKDPSQESPNNITKANVGDFIVTKKTSRQYRDAVDNNDKIAKDTILMNIRNHKIAKQGGLKGKYADGDSVTPAYYPLGTNQYNIPDNVTNQLNVSANPRAKESDYIPMPIDTVYNSDHSAIAKHVNINSQSPTQASFDTLAKYGPSMFNMAQGMFGKVARQPLGTPATNPYLSQIQDNMPRRVNYDPMIADAYKQEASANKDIQDHTNNAAAYRSQRQNLAYNTTKNIAGIKMQTQEANSNIDRQRAGIYENLGDQAFKDQQSLRGYNFEVNNANNRALAAKQNYLTTGLGQMQQTYMNDRYNDKQLAMQRYQTNLLKYISPAIAHYLEFDPQYTRNINQ